MNFVKYLSGAECDLNAERGKVKSKNAKSKNAAHSSSAAGLQHMCTTLNVKHAAPEFLSFAFLLLTFCFKLSASKKM